MTDQPVSVTLNTAADLIEERGWITGTGWPTGDTAAPLCLEGGIAAAMGISDFLNLSDLEADAFDGCPAYRAVSSYLDHYWALYTWNDARGRTASEVIEVLRACALIEAARESQDAAEATYAENLAAAL